jgi:CheY-like chemotaxis protein
MADRVFRIIIVPCGQGAAPSVSTDLELDVIHAPYSIVTEDAQSAIRAVEAGTVDLLLLDTGENTAAALDFLETLHTRTVHTPAIVLTPEHDDGFALKALRAGAEDCLVKGDPVRSILARAVTHAIERDLFLSRANEARQHDDQARELDGLEALCGPSPLPVTEKSFGLRSVRERIATDYDSLVTLYGDLLDRALDRQRLKARDDLDVRLQQLADRLGVLNAGPRDVVDLHKAAITSKIKGQSTRKARAYIEEGRLVMLQLMGHLVTFYRTLSWGSGVRQPRTAEPILKPNAVSKDY